ncbi:MAG: hypothetical protein GC201_06275 [Alphaproteobacteria bacterium]|nr:hypothetical protein [Alphaproteobacteria bacterium]
MNWPALFGTTPGVTVAVTLVFMGGCALMTGRALARTWRPAWHLVPYVLLLAVADRFFTYALFEGALLSWSGFLLDAVILGALAGLSFQAVKARLMVSQYPWLFQSAGPLAWRRRHRR